MSSKVGPSKQLYSAAQRRTKDRVSAGSQPVKKKGSSILRLLKRFLRQVSKGVKTDIKEAKKIWLPFPAVLCLFVIALPPGPHQAWHKMAAQPRNRSAPKVDFVYRLGRTTLEEARAYWAQNGMKIVGAGQLALGGGSGMDGAARVSAEKVLLVDVSGIDFEGISNAQFGFYDNTLYRIQATLTPISLKGSSARSYTDQEMKALGIALRKKYGTPSREQRTLMADKKSGNDVLIWNMPTGKLTLTATAINGSLILSDEKMEADVRTYIKDYCKSINTPGHIVCW